MSEKLIVQALMIDVNETRRQLRFRFSIKGNGLQIRSNDFVIGAAPIFIDGGVPLRLSNLDLRPYFELQNLNGITPQQYINPLPGGSYQFCFEVFDWVSGQRLSNPNLGCFNAFLIINDPPFLNLPRRGDLVASKNPQNILFNWTPRHLNASGVQYEFELREVWDTQIDPQAAFLASPNLYSTTTFNTTLLYGPGETTLLENKTYAWRVRAIVTDGISEASIFHNNGYSEIYYFTYTADCQSPQFALAKSLRTSSEEITWMPDPDHLKYKVQYRKKGVRDAVWFEVNAVNPYTTLHNLEPGTTYKYRVGGQCTQTVANTEPRFSYNAVQEFTTPTKTEDSYYNCGIAPEVAITNREPLDNIGVNEVFTAGDFPVTIKQVNGGNGTFSGLGYIVVPYLADTKIEVAFKNIGINTDYQLYKGKLRTTYDASWGNMDDIQDELDAVGYLVTALGETLDEIITIIKENTDINQQANVFIELMQETLDDPNNGLSIGEQQNLQTFINDKEKVKEAIKQVKEDFASGKNDESIKQNLVSSFAPSYTGVEDNESISEEVKIFYCDSIIKLNKRNILISDCNKLKLVYKKIDSSNTKTVDIQLKITTSNNTKNKILPSKDNWKTVNYNEVWEIDLESIPPGEYTANLKVNDSVYKHEFLIHEECTSGYCCTVCDRDLTVTVTKLEDLFKGSKSKQLTVNTAAIFTKALKDGGFTTCKQLAHFFSQIKLECNNFEDFLEGHWYRLLNIYNTFGGQTGNNTIETIYSQSFWDDEKYIDYISSNRCPYRYVDEPEDSISTKYKASIETITKSRNGFSIIFPESFSKSKDSTASYVLKRINDKVNGKNLLNLVYNNKNGNNTDEDGWKYRGRGIIQLTGRENYRRASDKANSIYGTTFDWENNPEQLENDIESIIYSATSWFLNNFKPISSLDTKTSSQVTKTVNTKMLHSKERKENYDRLTTDIKLYKCNEQ
ncbi:fibronectin type III domain-containing protein [Zhouia spongiae]|uniref:Fibronectin type III domain-containing protein n=1 Tax=Zhouia spongiae TaxID=2202721 RepID=A0ABY3YND5_9FLAO|nr:fibronectin type III domain-containing protein [Zhouia spongiae]UNY99054.1 fibronectin type III domain-containing protein [Zhouia spongiae]